MPAPALLIACAEPHWGSLAELARAEGWTPLLADPRDDIARRVRDELPQAVIAEDPGVCTRLKDDPTTSATWVLLLAADPDATAQREPRADGYLPLPFRSGAVRSVLSALHARSREAERSTEARALSAARLRSRRRVLVIEDNLDAAESLKDALEIDEHEVTLAHTGPDGLQKARELAPDVVFCDIGLPGLDGYGVARAIRADEQLRRMFLVALTGYAQPEDVARAMQAGFDRHVAKPPSIAKILAVLGEAPAPAARVPAG